MKYNFFFLSPKNVTSLPLGELNILGFFKFWFFLTFSYGIYIAIEVSLIIYFYELVFNMFFKKIVEKILHKLSQSIVLKNQIKCNQNNLSP